MSVTFKEEDEDKLQLLVASIGHSKAQSLASPQTTRGYAILTRILETDWLVLEGLLVYWLPWFILPRGQEDGLNNYVFPLAILLAKGERLALTPTYLGSLYARQCIANIAGSLGRYDVVAHANSSFLHTFLWIHFGAFAQID